VESLHDAVTSALREADRALTLPFASRAATATKYRPSGRSERVAVVTVASCTTVLFAMVTGADRE